MTSPGRDVQRGISVLVLPDDGRDREAGDKNFRNLWEAHAACGVEHLGMTTISRKEVLVLRPNALQGFGKTPFCAAQDDVRRRLDLVAAVEIKAHDNVYDFDSAIPDCFGEQSGTQLASLLRGFLGPFRHQGFQQVRSAKPGT